MTNQKNETHYDSAGRVKSLTSTILMSKKASTNVFFNTSFDKNSLKNLIAWFLDEYGEKETVDLVEILKTVGFHQATQAGVSLGLDDLQIPPQKKTLLSQASAKMSDVNHALQTGNVTSVEKSQRLIDTWNQTSESLRQSAVQTFRTTNPVNPVYMMAFSGARGNISQVRQLVAMRGLMADPQGAILEFPIQSNFREGLTVTEYLISCYGARKGLVDTALRTATSGYLTRRLVDAVQHVVVHVTDCQTNQGIVLKEKNLEQRLIGRVLVEDIVLNSTTQLKKNTLITAPLAKQIVLKTKEVRVRSPLTCQTEKSVCQFCYGLDLGRGKLVSIGEAVGIIAGQSIGEPGTQLTMRTFHTGGVGVFSEQALKSFTAPFEGKVEFLHPLPGLFVRTPHGNIVYLLKHTTTDDKKPLLRVSGVSSQNQFYEILLKDIPAGSLVWVRHGEQVKTGQLLIQASRFQAATQEMPESTHPVPSPLSGEVNFEFMATRIIEEQKKITKKKKSDSKKLFFGTSQINKKEIAPLFPTLLQLGKFWVFSSFLQKETHFSHSFFVPGDLVSRETPIQEYRLYVPSKSQISYSNSSLISSNSVFDFWVSKTQFRQGVYFFRTSNNSPQKQVISLNSNSKNTLLTWYPFFTNKILGSSCSLPNDYPTSFVWTPQPIQRILPKKLSFDSNFTKNRPFVLRKSDQGGVTAGLLHCNENSNFSDSVKQVRGTLFLENPLRKTKTKVFLISDSLLAFKARQEIFLKEPSLNLIEHSRSWFYYPSKTLTNLVDSHIEKVIIEPGKVFENIRFPSSHVSITLINNKNVECLSEKESQNYKYDFYHIDQIKEKTEFVKNKFFTRNSQVSVIDYSEQKQNHFSFYKKSSSKLVFLLRRKYKVSYAISFQQSKYCMKPEIRQLKQTWLDLKKPKYYLSTKSPLFTKQYKSHQIFQKIQIPEMKIVSSNKLQRTETWQDWKLKISFTVPKNNFKIESFHHKQYLSTLHKQSCINVVPAFTLKFSRNLKLENSTQYNFQTFESGWVIPEIYVSQAFLRSKQVGEFGGFQKKTQDKETWLSIIRVEDTITLKLFHQQNLLHQKDSYIGVKVRFGQELVPTYAAPVCGQVIKYTQNTVTLRKGVPLLASTRGLVHIAEKDFVQKNDLLLTLRSRRLQTEDIVQGIPKIEQLFEARETQGGETLQNNMHSLLANFFTRARQIKPNREAVNISLTYIQKYLVESILEAYSNQGVHIAEKHVEIVVRQMTARVRILQGGDTGFLPGEFIQLRLLERVNRRLIELGRRPALYEPAILGITKSVLQSESFLLAASFQQVSKVLVRSALAKKTDFLRGLHENILVGQPIPAGTGLIDFQEAQLSDEHSKTQRDQIIGLSEPLKLDFLSGSEE